MKGLKFVAAITAIARCSMTHAETLLPTMWRRRTCRRPSVFLLLAALLAAFATNTAAQTDDRGIRVDARVVEQMRTERRVALVIGNASYRVSPLRNPINDAQAMAVALRRLGFEVISETDATEKRMLKVILKFGRKLKTGGVGLFYYAGHGVQTGGRNYMIPIGAEIEVEDDVEIESVDVNKVLGRMGGARNRLNIVILDACRNNPYAKSFRSPTRGLATTLAPTGTYIAYSAAPGQVAADGDGANSMFTAALLGEMARASRRLEDVFKAVRVNVLARTGGRQVPWTSSSITGDFYFKVPNHVTASAAPETLDLSGLVPLDTPKSTAKTTKLLSIDELMELGKTPEKVESSGTPPEPPTATPKFSLGDPVDFDPFPTTASIAEVQRRLAALGYQPGPVDGIMGRQTRKAIVQFQRSVGLLATGHTAGEISDALLSSLRKAKPQPAAVVTPPRVEAPSAVQLADEAKIHNIEYPSRLYGEHRAIVTVETNKPKIECVAYKDNIPVGSGSGYTKARIANVGVSVTRRPGRLTVRCF